MAWTSPMTAVANAAFTAAQFNTHVRDNMNETAPAKATAAGRIFVTTGANAIAERAITEDVVAASESTTSTSFTDLTTTGPTVTVTTGTKALVFIHGTLANNTGSVSSVMSFAVSGASTISASDDNSIQQRDSGTGGNLRASAVVLLSSLTSGSNTFTAKYRVGGASTGTFGRRSLIVVGL